MTLSSPLRTVLLTAVAAVALAALPASAPAATVAVDHIAEPAFGPEDLGDFSLVTYTAARGERNRLRVWGDSDTIFVLDRGARVRPGKGCRRLNAHKVRCAIAADADLIDLVRVDVGDRDDQVRIVADTAADERYNRVSGGAGNDRLSGGKDTESFEGGPGDDVLAGGAGEDAFDCGAGFDSVLDWSPSEAFAATCEEGGEPSDAGDGEGGRVPVDHAP